MEESIELGQVLNSPVIPRHKLCIKCKIRMYELLRNFSDKSENEEENNTGPGFDSPDIELKRIEKKFARQNIHQFNPFHELQDSTPGEGINLRSRDAVCKQCDPPFQDSDITEKVKNGFSKFCSLRPKWCILPGSSGTHSVCDCAIHQNAKLLVDALQIKEKYSELMNYVVCSQESRDCMIHRNNLIFYF